MKTGLFEAGFFLKKLIPPNPLTYNNFNFRILVSEIPPKAKILVLFIRAKLLNLYKFKYLCDFFTLNNGERNIALQFC